MGHRYSRTAAYSRPVILELGTTTACTQRVTAIMSKMLDQSIDEA